MISHLRRYFISGLLVLLPIWVTFLLLGFFINAIDHSLLMLPKELQPDHLLGFHVPGLGVIVVCIIIIITGMMVANFIGRHFLSYWDNLISRIPFVRSIYNAVKQMSETLFSSSGQSFRNVYLVEYPRKGMWSLGFQTGKGSAEIQSHMKDKDILTLFIPTTPNPTSGYLVMVPRSEAFDCEMSVEDGLKFVISLGVVQPPFHGRAGTETLTTE